MTDTNIVERVARELMRLDGLDEECSNYVGGYVVWRSYEKHARAAIAAMREPSEDMTDPDVVGVVVGCCFTNREDLKEVWRAMIDAALETPAGKEE